MITSTIKSKKFTIYFKTNRGNELKVDVPVIQDIVGSNVKISSHNQNSSVITFEGPISLVFGFQAIRLFYNKGHYTRQEPIKSNIPMRGPAKSKGIKLVSKGPFVKMADE